MAEVAAAMRAVILDALVQPKPFHGHGVWSFPHDQLNLFLAKEPTRLNLSHGGASADDIAKLAVACAPATFGLNQTNVLDESYRKAGKLDRNDFAINIDISGSGLLKAVQESLFGWEDSPREIRAELYKLNVYGPESFFKAHKDTPRGGDMFGSLVLTFLTQHQGGALVLRHDGQEIVLDASTADYTSPDQVYWSAFYSDVEHEVLPVQSGHRVTLTYNLYFVSASPISSTRSAHVDPILAAFKTVLANREFLPHGAILGFGLAHQYPIPSDKLGNRGLLKSLVNVLKGSDRALFYAAQAAGLKPVLHVVYETSSDYESYVLDHFIEEDYGHQVGHLMEESMSLEYLSIMQISNRSEDEKDWFSEYAIQRNELLWIVPRNDNARVKTFHVAYGNEATLGFAYGNVVLTLTVPHVKQRSNLQ